MKSFFKYLLATVIGMLIVSLIMFFVTIGTIGAMFASSGSSATKRFQRFFRYEACQGQFHLADRPRQSDCR